MKRLFLLSISLVICYSSAMAATAKKIPIYGHRGARGLAPENTIPAYKVGLAIGVDYVDMDVNMTKDGVVVVTHDSALNPSLTRDNEGHWIGKKKIFIKDLSFRKLQQYDVGRLKKGGFYATEFPEQQAVDKTHISSLKQVIEYVKKTTHGHVKYQVELKTDPAHPDWTFPPAKLAKATVRILQEEGVAAKTEVQAFDWRALQVVQQEDPSIATAYLTDAQISANMSSPIVTIAGLWTGGKLLKNYDYSIPKMIAVLGGKIWGPESCELTMDLVDEAHRYGLKVVPWTVDSVVEIERMLQLRVDGIITDYPERLRGVMLAHGMGVSEIFV